MKYSLLCAIIGDVIGYGNGDIEFNFDLNLKVNNRNDIDRLSDISIRHVVDFISKGGYSNIDISNDIASDDTILMLGVYKALKSNKSNDLDKIVDSINTHLISSYKNDSKKDLRGYGYRTIKALERNMEGKDWRNFGYSESAGGSGASMRCSPIGLFFSGANNRDKLMYISIESSRITHNNGIGYLGGYASALMTAMAIEGIEPNKWIFELISNLKSQKMKQHIEQVICGNKFKNDLDKHLNDLSLFTSYCCNYTKSRKPINENPSMKYFNLRSAFYYNHLALRKGMLNPGSSGLDSVLIAYDSFLDCNGSFETLIYYSMLHVGDSDTTGCIAGALFGAYYGEFNLSDNLRKVEFHSEIN